ncbi:MAG: CopG family antitoxin [Candidatus Omnitrophota bacterium]
MKKLNKKIKTEEFDERFDAGEDMWDFLYTRRVKVHKNVRRINIDFPETMLEQIDEEAHKIGVARSALIKLWLAEKLEHA